MKLWCTENSLMNIISTGNDGKMQANHRRQHNRLNGRQQKDISSTVYSLCIRYEWLIIGLFSFLLLSTRSLGVDFCRFCLLVVAVLMPAQGNVLCVCAHCTHTPWYDCYTILASVRITLTGTEDFSFEPQVKRKTFGMHFIALILTRLLYSGHIHALHIRTVCFNKCT